MKVSSFNSPDIIFDPNTIITVGTFDGFHKGHHEIVRRMKQVAARTQARVVVVTFDPHPQIVLAKPDREPVKLLTTIEERCSAFESAGVDETVVIPFSKEFASIEAEDFVRSVVAKIGVSTFFVGHDHNFGRNRDGNEALLQRLGTELSFNVEHVDALDCDGLVVSSTKIRHAIANGNMALAETMLGRPYSVSGIVHRGDARGRTIGYPTANIKVASEHKLLPQNGVYVVSSEFGVLNGIQNSVFGMANVGVRPTFTTDVVPTLEVHFLDVDLDLYDRTITVHFHNKLRDEMKFASVAELVEQIQQDELKTRISINNIIGMES